MKSIEDLDVFKKAHKLTLEIYKITSSYPKDEIYGLISQMRRAAVSINSNLMEGGARLGKAELKQFIGIARGSATELKYQLFLSGELNYIDKKTSDKFAGEINEIVKMLSGLIKSVEN